MNLRRLALMVLLRAWQDATSTWERKYRLQARRFLLNAEAESMLPFWCELAEIPVNRIVKAARQSAAEGWRKR